MPHSFTKISYAEIGESLLRAPPEKELECVVVIPVFAEKSVLTTLRSLSNGTIQRTRAEVILLINQSDVVDPAHARINESCFEELLDFDQDKLIVHVVYVTDIPAKIAGVGTARKLAMDTAADRLIGGGKSENGIIVNLDADCTISSNYFTAILAYFEKFKKIELANIYFEHDLSGCRNAAEKAAVIKYELHLRYFIGMQRWLQLPYAYQTIGSSFAVRADAYKSMGGMNRRKAGEDFYFIHKFTKKDRVGDLNTCTVYPSGRPSFRVPFGTGKAVMDILENHGQLATYHPQSLRDLKQFIEKTDKLYTDEFSWKIELPIPIRTYLENQNFDSILHKLRSNARSEKTFRKAFFQWFDAFRLMKYLHFSRDLFYKNVPVDKAIFLANDIFKIDPDLQLHEKLEKLRNLSRQGL